MITGSIQPFQITGFQGVQIIPHGNPLDTGIAERFFQHLTAFIVFVIAFHAYAGEINRNIPFLCFFQYVRNVKIKFFPLEFDDSAAVKNNQVRRRNHGIVFGIEIIMVNDILFPGGTGKGAL